MASHGQGCHEASAGLHSSDLWGVPINDDDDDDEIVFVKVNFLGTTGGKDVADTTRRILANHGDKCRMSNELFRSRQEDSLQT